MSRVKEILRKAEKRDFANLYQSTDSEARELVDALVDRVLAKYPDIRIYPTDKPDLRLSPGPRVAATLDLKKRPPYLRINLLKIPNAIPGTRIQFEKTSVAVLPSRIRVGAQAELDDAMRYLERAIENARQV